MRLIGRHLQPLYENNVADGLADTNGDGEVPDPAIDSSRSSSRSPTSCHPPHEGRRRGCPITPENRSGPRASFHFALERVPVARRRSWQSRRSRRPIATKVTQSAHPPGFQGAGRVATGEECRHQQARAVASALTTRGVREADEVRAGPSRPIMIQRAPGRLRGPPEGLPGAFDLICSFSSGSACCARRTRSARTRRSKVVEERGKARRRRAAYHGRGHLSTRPATRQIPATIRGWYRRHKTAETKKYGSTDLAKWTPEDRDLMAQCKAETRQGRRPAASAARKLPDLTAEIAFERSSASTSWATRSRRTRSTRSSSS